MRRAIPYVVPVGIGLVGLVIGCGRAEPPTLKGFDAAVAPLPGPSGASAAPASASASASASATATASATASASAPAPATAALAVLDSGTDPGTLPQTKDKPAAKGDAFDARVAALFKGIVDDDPDAAMPFFFPVTAYEQVKAVGNPAGDWRRRLVTAFKRDIHALHKRLGEHASEAKLVRADVPDDRMKWVEPDEEYNKLGYYRVYGTRLVYAVDGKERTFEVSSLISWRGEWYVVHLTGFK